MGTPAVGDIVLVPFPYSDLSERKLRPAFVAALVERNDLILCQITSRPYASDRSILLTDDTSGLERVSYLRPDKLFTADARLIVRALGSVETSTLAAVRTAIAALFA